LMVYYCWKGTVDRPYYDPTFQAEIKWDLPLLDGYRYRFLGNLYPRPVPPLGRFLNPGIVPALITGRYDAVFVWGYNYLTAWLAFLAAAISRIPVFLGGNVVPRPRRPLPVRALKQAVLSPLCRRTAAIMSECARNAEYYLSYGADPGKVYWNPAAVDNEFFQTEAVRLAGEKREIKRGLNLPPDLPAYIFVGRFDSRKRVLDLLEAFRRLGDPPEASLVFVGEGAQRRDLERLIFRHRLPNVTITGFRDQTELPRFLAAGDVFVLPSGYDPSPRALNEAMNFALPAVVSDGVGTAGDLVVDGENGFIFPVGEIGILADRMRRFLDNPGLRQEMGERALRMVSKWNYRKGAEEIFRALRSLP
jgi:glycosyltransferase involved in cell wall biosynthesis